jgi:hypothetical protein
VAPAPRRRGLFASRRRPVAAQASSTGDDDGEFFVFRFDVFEAAVAPVSILSPVLLFSSFPSSALTHARNRR